jgi:hypothetical protein
MSFTEATAEFAYSEGEDDRTLDSWRREHRKYYTRVLAARGGEKNSMRLPSSSLNPSISFTQKVPPKSKC